MHFYDAVPAYAELGKTAREYTLRMVELTSQAATSGMGRELSTAFACVSNGLALLQMSAEQESVTGIIKGQHHLAEECQDHVVQNVRNSLQIAELTKAEMLHWQKRWATELISFAFAPYQQKNRAH